MRLSKGELLRYIDNLGLCEDEVIAALVALVDGESNAFEAGWIFALEAATKAVEDVRLNLLPGDGAVAALDLVDQELDQAFADPPTWQPGDDMPRFNGRAPHAVPQRSASGSSKKPKKNPPALRSNQLAVVAFLENAAGATAERSTVIKHLEEKGVSNTGAHNTLGSLIKRDVIVQVGHLLRLHSAT